MRQSTDMQTARQLLQLNWALVQCESTCTNVHSSGQTRSGVNCLAHTSLYSTKSIQNWRGLNLAAYGPLVMMTLPSATLSYLYTDRRLVLSLFLARGCLIWQTCDTVWAEVKPKAWQLANMIVSDFLSKKNCINFVCVHMNNLWSLTW